MMLLLTMLLDWNSTKKLLVCFGVMEASERYRKREREGNLPRAHNFGVLVPPAVATLFLHESFFIYKYIDTRGTSNFSINKRLYNLGWTTSQIPGFLLFNNIRNLFIIFVKSEKTEIIYLTTVVDIIKRIKALKLLATSFLSGAERLPQGHTFFVNWCEWSRTPTKTKIA